MPNLASPLVGVVEELWRYPVKSMLGEQLNATEITERWTGGGSRVRAARHIRRQDRNREESAEVAESVQLRGRADWCCYGRREAAGRANHASGRHHQH
jgi:hypothetical protein